MLWANADEPKEFWTTVPWSPAFGGRWWLGCDEIAADSNGWMPRSNCSCDAWNHWIGSRENLKQKPWFLPSNIGLSCKFSHHPILWWKWRFSWWFHDGFMMVSWRFHDDLVTLQFFFRCNQNKNGFTSERELVCDQTRTGILESNSGQILFLHEQTQARSATTKKKWEYMAIDQKRVMYVQEGGSRC